MGFVGFVGLPDVDLDVELRRFACLVPDGGFLDLI